MSTTTARGNKRILVVDDDRSVCDLLGRMLTLRGYAADTARDGPAALRLVAQQDYGLALIDYRMPGMDGVDLCARLHELRPQMVAIFVTGFPTIDTVFPAITAGAERVLAKPIGPQELFQVVEEFIGKPQL